MDVVVRGSGRYVPERVFSNEEFTAFVETSDEWITERTGIRERRFSAPGQLVSDMALLAAQDCLAKLGISSDDIDLIIVATVTGDTIFPATANWLQGKLGNKRAWSFDVNAGCGGFVYALSVATGLLRSGQNRYALVVGAEKMSAIMDFTDRSTCVLFGDAAACLLLEAVAPQDNPQHLGLQDFVLGSDGSLASILYQPAGGSNLPPSHASIEAHKHFIHMSGRDVYINAVRRMEQVVVDVLERCGQKPADVDWFVAHQANARIITSVQERLGVPPERVYINVERFGNTTAATIPLCLDELSEDGRLTSGQKVVLFTFGAGFTWGSCYLTWGAPEARQ
jgi:3-oxoacyl-[acyl-carrier-protein] synthase-3